MMEQGSSEYQEFTDLLSALQDESATEQQLEKLDEIMCSASDARRIYMDYVNLDDCLDNMVNKTEMFLPEPALSSMQPKSSGNHLKLIRIITGLSVLAATMLIVIFLQWRSSTIPAQTNLTEDNRSDSKPEPSTKGEELTDNSVAILAQSVDVQWSKTSDSFRPGSALPPSTLQIENGLLRIEFYSGATVIIEGPARFELVSKMKARCSSGRIRAQVPPLASGFTIETPDTELVDLGTEFGMNVNAGKATDVFVFDGKVELYDVETERNIKSRKVLTVGQSIRLGGSGESSLTNAISKFASFQAIESKMIELTTKQQDLWLKNLESLKVDPDVLSFYTFEKTENHSANTLINQSAIYKGLWNGFKIGCDKHEGRFPWKEAYRFQQISDRVRINVPGSFESLTLASWLRIDQLPETYGSILMSDGYETGEIHWQVSSKGEVNFSVQGDENQNGTSYNLGAKIPDHQLGRWVHLAVVYDRKSGKVFSYLNGEETNSAKIQAEPSLRIGTAEIGNWFTEKHKTGRPIRNLTGSLDELIIVSRAFSKQEIQTLYSTGANF